MVKKISWNELTDISLKTVEKFIEQGGDVNEKIVDEYGTRTPICAIEPYFCYGIQGKTQEDYCRAVKILLENGARFEAFPDLNNRYFASSDWSAYDAFCTVAYLKGRKETLDLFCKNGVKAENLLNGAFKDVDLDVWIKQGWIYNPTRDFLTSRWFYDTKSIMKKILLDVDSLPEKEQPERLKSLEKMEFISEHPNAFKMILEEAKKDLMIKEEKVLWADIYDGSVESVQKFIELGGDPNEKVPFFKSIDQNDLTKEKDCSPLFCCSWYFDKYFKFHSSVDEFEEIKGTKKGKDLMKKIREDVAKKIKILLKAGAKVDDNVIGDFLRYDEMSGFPELVGIPRCYDDLRSEIWKIGIGQIWMLNDPEIYSESKNARQMSDYFAKFLQKEERERRKIRQKLAKIENPEEKKNLIEMLKKGSEERDNVAKILKNPDRKILGKSLFLARQKLLAQQKLKEKKRS